MKKALLSAIAALSLSGAFQLSYASIAHAADPVKIGFVAPLSGPFASLGQAMDRGARLYEKVHGDDLPEGVEIEVIRRDDAGVPDNTRRIAQELIVRDGVKALTGIALSPQGFAIAPLATSAKIPVALMVATTSSLTRSSPYFVRFSYTQWQMAYSMGVWAAKNDIQSSAIMVADYAPGLDSEKAFTKGFEENGGKVVSSVHVPLVTNDYLPFMKTMEASKPGAIFTFVNEGRMPGVVSAFLGTDMKADGVRLIGPGDIAHDDELLNMPPELAGLVTAATYSVDNKAPTNQAFLEAWKKEYGEDSLPNITAVAAWDAMDALYSAVGDLGAKATSDDILEYLRNWSGKNSPRPDMRIDPETRDIVQPIYMNRVESVDGELRNVTFETMPPLKDPWKTFNPEE